MKTNIRLDAGGAGGDGSSAGGGGAGAGAGGGKSMMNGGEGGTPTKSFLDTLPDTYRGEPSLANIKSLDDLAKGYVNAQKLVGVDKIPGPQKNWNDQQWAEHFDRLGRPKTAADYAAAADVKLSESIQLDDKRLSGFKEQFHKLGLTKAQGDGILTEYYKSLNEGEGATLAQLKASREQSEQTLKSELGDKFDASLKLAQHAASQLGGPELIKALDETGMGNHPQIIRAFLKAGQLLSEDGDRHPGFVPQVGIAAAAAEIGKLKTDKDFLSALNTQSHPGHKDAVARWTVLHRELTAQ